MLPMCEWPLTDPAHPRSWVSPQLLYEAFSEDCFWVAFQSGDHGLVWLIEKLSIW